VLCVTERVRGSGGKVHRFPARAVGWPAWRALIGSWC
jgi:hypothetical protein